ncbi:hypothetical protein [Streptomyces hainanensis]|uniref:Uncharacterized protein n=1 Tax=Streptomyces hainanensis TaxID=402648 RepID=A0A4R4SGU7_9ACTN|nr:hypothetical protein [Streptomyces hainanensis]TDC62668.1 hypothetical protein E1283_33700 [Streptomyces hainanensis]
MDLSPPTPATPAGPRPAVELTIGELVLDGFPPAHADRISESFRRELTRLVTEHGLPLATTPGDELRATLPELPRHLPPHRLGEALARTVHAALTDPGRAQERRRPR